MSRNGHYAKAPFYVISLDQHRNLRSNLCTSSQNSELAHLSSGCNINTFPKGSARLWTLSLACCRFKRCKVAARSHQAKTASQQL